MYRVAIVDDEPIVRKGLVNLVPWPQLQCEVVCEASDGQEFVEQLKNADVDVVLSDIKMPRMDGIALCAWLHEHRPEIRTILLTAYSDFEYARQCMKYGVTDYVMKSGGMGEVSAAVQRATALLEETKLSQTQLGEEDLYTMQRNFLKNVIDGIWSGPEVIESKCGRLQLELKTFCVLSLELGLQGGGGNMDYLNAPDSMLHFLDLSFKEYRAWIVPVSKRIFAVVLAQDNMELTPDGVAHTARKVIETLSNMLGTLVFVGMSAVGQGLSDLFACYQQAREALNRRFMSDASSLYQYQDKTREIPVNLTALEQAIDELFSHIRFGDLEGTEQSLRSMLAMQKNGNIPAEMLKSQALMLNARCSRLLAEYHINAENIYNNDIRFYKAVIGCQSLDEYKQVLSPVLCATCEKMREAGSGANGIVQQARAFIRERYRENITLAEIAAHVHVNPSYLSRLYKEETGSTVMAEVNTLKVERVKELLRRPETTVLMAAMEIGIDDPSVFSHFFKKNVGVSPRQYQRNPI